MTPTRLGRHGVVLAPGPDERFRIDLTAARFKASQEPIEDGCPCPACSAGLSRGYLRYLAKNRELTGVRLLSLHNLVYIARADARPARRDRGGHAQRDGGAAAAGGRSVSGCGVDSSVASCSASRMMSATPLRRACHSASGWIDRAQVEQRLSDFGTITCRARRWTPSTIASPTSDIGAHFENAPPQPLAALLRRRPVEAAADHVGVDEGEVGDADLRAGVGDLDAQRVAERLDAGLRRRVGGQHRRVDQRARPTR